MKKLSLSNFTPEQKQALRDAYQFIRKRAAWLRIQEKMATNQEGQKSHAPVTILNTKKNHAGL
jgi:hypothetical protein